MPDTTLTSDNVHSGELADYRGGLVVAAQAAALAQVERNIASFGQRFAVNAQNGDKQLSLEIEAAANNYGSGGAVDYATKNNTNANYRPMLIITSN